MDRPRESRRLPVLEGQPFNEHNLPLAAESRAVDQRLRPIYCVWETTLACDQNCRHCGSRAGRERLDELTTEERLDVVRQLAELGCMEVTVTGGEAYLREDWLDVIRAIRAAGMHCTMVTAGKGVTPEVARAAKEAGLMSVSVSIDGIEATHDRLRGVSGSHASALRAMRNFREAGVKISANTQINRLSIPDLPQILETIIEAGVHAWQIQLTLAMGRAADEPEVLLQPHDVLVFYPMLPELKARCVEARVTLWPGDNIGYFGPYETLLRGTMPLGYMGSCGAGRLVIGLEADGTVKGCTSQATARWSGGNVRDHSMRDIWERSPQLRYTRDRTLDDLWGYCRTCYYAEQCRAGCTSTSFVLFGRTGNNPYCHHRALEMERAGKRERLVPAAPAPGAPFDWGTFDIVVEEIALAASSTP